MNFESFHFDPIIQNALKGAKFEKPTPIQDQAIPLVMEGHDLMGLAQTGTGKTAAFVLPMVQRLSRQQRSGVRALILAPTRELAIQIEEVVRVFGARLGIKSMTAFGGVSLQRQIHELQRGASVVVGCPGRVLDLMEQRALDVRNIEVLVLDEADHMFDIGFLPTVRRIVRALPSNRQNLLFSATMPPDIKQLAAEILRNPKTVQVEHQKPVATVTHALYPVRQDQKSELLFSLLKTLDTGSMLVFTRTKHRAKKLARQLADGGHTACSLQGNMSQNQREAAMKGFRAGKYRILVATDIAARGIDISTVTHVINFDIPDTVEAYTHRIGRTGRAERNGDAFTFVTREDSSMVRDIERMLGSRIPLRSSEGLVSNQPPAQAFDQREPRAYPERRFGSQQRGQGGSRPRRSEQPRHGGSRPPRRGEGGGSFRSDRRDRFSDRNRQSQW